jgi:hypothetical protein
MIDIGGLTWQQDWSTERQRRARNLTLGQTSGVLFQMVVRRGQALA